MKKAPVLTAVLVFLIAFTALATPKKKTKAPKAPITSAQVKSEAPLPTSIPFGTFNETLARAAAEKKYVMLDFSTDWCKWCKVLDAKTYTDTAVIRLAVRSFCCAKVDPEKEGRYSYKGKSYDGPGIQSLFHIEGFPTNVFMDSGGNVVGQISGYFPPEKFIRILAFIANGEHKTKSLDEYIGNLNKQ